MNTIQSFFSEGNLMPRLLQITAFIRLFIGNYVTINESRSICNLVKLYCIGVCFSIAIVYFYINIRIYTFTMYSLTVVDYFITALIFIVNGDQNIIQYFSTIQTHDRIIGFKKIFFTTYFVYFILFCTFLLRFGFFIYRCIVGTRSIVEFILTVITLIAMDLNYLLIINIFSALQYRINQLRLFLESNPIPINISGPNQIAISIQNVKKSLFYYDKLLDNLHSLDKILQIKLTLYLITNFLRVCFVYYRLIQQYMAMDKLLISTIHVLEMLPIVIMASSPALIVEATVYEVDRIKKTLTTQILRCSDESLRFELETALQYLNLRPFRYTICRAVPLDINQLLSMTGLCITYVLVACQLVFFAN